MTTYYTRVSYSYDGSTNIFTIPFNYSKKEFIRIEVTASDGIVTEYVLDNDFSFINDGQISLSTLPDIGSIIEIYRNRKKDEREESFSNGEVYVHELNNSFDQDFETAQEAYDLATKSVVDSRGTKSIAIEARDLADKAIADSALALDITSGMQDEVHAAAEAAIKATAMAEQSTHAHLNLKSLDTIEVDTTGSFELSVNGQRVAMASELPDWSQFAQTDGSNADAEAYQALVGMPEVKNDISELSVSTAKTDGSNITVEEWRILLGIKDGVTAGTVAYYCAESPPDGWLVANGAEINRTDYSDLFTVIGTTFGEGDGTTTFNMPDLRGVFLRGVDNGRGIDTDRTLGSYQADDNKSHNHAMRIIALSGSSPYGLARYAGSSNFNLDTTTSGEKEARPKNVALLPCIKY